MRFLFSKPEGGHPGLRVGVVSPQRTSAIAHFMQKISGKLLNVVTACSLLIILGLSFSSQVYAGNAVNGSNLFHGVTGTFNCYGCHSVGYTAGGLPLLPQLNAANASNSSVLNFAIANNYGGAMGAYKSTTVDASDGGQPLTATQRDDIAAYLQTLIVPISTTVAYHGSTTATPLKVSLDAAVANFTPAEFNAIAFTSQTNGTVASGTAVSTVSLAGGYTISESTGVFTHTANNCSDGSYIATASGSGGSSSSRSVTVTVTPPAGPNLGTSATTSSPAFNTGTAIAITNSGGPISSISNIAALSNGGSLVTNGTTSFTYTSSSTIYSATDAFTYRANGPCGSNSANVTVNISIAAPTPTAPAVITSANYNPGGAASTPISLVGPIANAVTGVTMISAPTQGTYTITGTTVNYTPEVGNLTAATFTYQTTGPGGTSATGTVTVNIVAPGAPTVTQPINLVAPYNVGGAAATSLALAGYISGTVGSIAITSAPALGTATVNGVSSVDFTPATASLVATSFNFTASAPGGATSAVSTVNITITPPGAPTIQNHPDSTPFNTSKTFSVAADISGPYTGITVGTFSAGGSAVVAGSNITYTPLTGFSGTETFNYTVTAPGGANSTAIITMTVIALPVAANMNATVPFNTATAITLPVTGFTQINIVAPLAAHGAVPTPAASSTSITYTPTTGYSGTDTISYTATGPGGTTATYTVSVTVSTLAPTATATTMTVPLNTATTIDLTPFVSGSSITGVSISAAPTHGAISLNGMIVTYTPTNNYFGADAFSYVAYGNAGTSPAAVVTVTVVGRPDPSRDVAVIGLLSAQADTSKRFSRAQISNFQGRMESLHRASEKSDDSAAGANASFNAKASPEVKAIRAAASGKMAPDERSVAPQINSKPTGAAYQPAATLASNSTIASNPTFGPPATNSAASGDVMMTIVSAIAASTGDASPSDPAAAVAKALMFTTTAVKSSTLNLNASTGNSGGSDGGFDYWVGGGVKIGNRNATSTSSASSFSTDGVSMGIDRRVSDKMALGIGVGFGRDTIDVGTDGTNSKARSTTVAAYGSYQPSEKTFLDGVIGYGLLNFETDRYVAAANAFANSKREGEHVFGSLTAGYEYRTQGLLVSPYGRLDATRDRLHQSTETGAGAFALRYNRQIMSSVQSALGLRFESAHDTDFGWALPRMRFEYQHDFKGDPQASVAYADLPGTSYTLSSASTNRNSYVLGVGSDFILRHGLKLSLDYQIQRSPGNDSSQGIFVKLVKSLDSRSPSSALLAPAAFSLHGMHIGAEAGYTYDSNVTRSSVATEKLADSSTSMHFTKGSIIPVSDHTRIKLNWLMGGEKFRTYEGLGKLYAGVESEFQYRPSGNFGSPTYALFGHITAEDYSSDLRDGYRYSTGLSVRKPVTDRINLFGAVAKNGRYGKSAVFDTNEYSARANLDYAMTASSTLYVGGEFRRGDVVSSGLPTLNVIDIAKVFVRDDVFTTAQLFDYRFEGKTVLFTLGYNWPFGPKDSLDFSWRRAQSKPVYRPGFATSGPSSYVDNQFSIIYLLSF